MATTAADDVIYIRISIVTRPAATRHCSIRPHRPDLEVVRVGLPFVRAHNMVATNRKQVVPSHDNRDIVNNGQQQPVTSDCHPLMN